MPHLLARATLPATDIWRSHPPVLHHSRKKTLLDLAGGMARVPVGTLAVSRWAASASETPLVGPAQRLLSVAGPFTYPAPEEGVDAWHVNFADPELFAFYGGPAFAQDEIQVAEHPVLASVRGFLKSDHGNPLLRAVSREPGRATPVLVRNVERWCAIDMFPALAPAGIYGRKLARASDDALRQAVRRIERGVPSHILAMAAPQGGYGEYSREQIRDVLDTAIAGFAAARAESAPGSQVRVHTGHWGTGAFGGHRVLMAAAQIVAARAASIDVLVYHSLDDDGAAALRQGAVIADSIPQGATIDAAVDALAARHFSWGESDGN
jgi:hypothetical protein